MDLNHYLALVGYLTLNVLHKLLSVSFTELVLSLLTLLIFCHICGHI